MNSPSIRSALISVSNKLGIIDFAAGLSRCGVAIYSTGGTRRHLEQAGIEVNDVAQYTGFPEMMDGRVKTLHPKIFAGILGRPDHPSDVQAMDQHQIVPFELVVVNLYPFAATIARPGVGLEQAIEQIDIGGPSLVRAAAKNSQFVTIVCDPTQYAGVLEQVQQTGTTTPELRSTLMARAFQHTADYDRTIAEYLAGQTENQPFPATIHLVMNRKFNLRYGENSHQSAALYGRGGAPGASVVNCRQLGGKQLSYNNLLDLDSALAIVRGLEQPAAAVIKHNNPCGAAIADTLETACAKALAGDPVSAFGSVIGANRTLGQATAEFLAGGDFFVEAILAPDFDAKAVEILTTKPKWKKNVRLVEVGPMSRTPAAREYRNLFGGMLVQTPDDQAEDENQWSPVTEIQPSPETMNELRFGWSIVRQVKSNAITLSRDLAVCGVGAGQMSRVDAVELAVKKASHRSRGAVLASDAFFPFADSIEIAAKAGIEAIIQPGGSVRDAEVIAACNQHRIAMIFTGRRHFRH